jgi:hypothetical protein
VGISAIIDCATARPEESTQKVDWEGKVALMQCAQAMGISRYIFFSIFNCEKHPEVPLMNIKACTEEYLAGSGLNYTILRLCGFMQVGAGPRAACAARPRACCARARARVSTRAWPRRHACLTAPTPGLVHLPQPLPLTHPPPTPPLPPPPPQAVIGNYAVPILEDRPVWGTNDETRTAYLDTQVRCRRGTGWRGAGRGRGRARLSPAPARLRVLLDARSLADPSRPSNPPPPPTRSQDIARMTMAALRSEECSGRTLTLAGPQAYTTKEVIEMCERMSDSKVRGMRGGGGCVWGWGGGWSRRRKRAGEEHESRGRLLVCKKRGWCRRRGHAVEMQGSEPCPYPNNRRRRSTPCRRGC